MYKYQLTSLLNWYRFVWTLKRNNQSEKVQKRDEGETPHVERTNLVKHFAEISSIVK